jgi:hypothetical protein
MALWGVLWQSRNTKGGDSGDLTYCGNTPALFPTRHEAREWIDAQRGRVPGRPNLRAIKVAVARQANTPSPINVIFDGPLGQKGRRSVEGVYTGEWVGRENGLWTLRITALPKKPVHHTESGSVPSHGSRNQE